MTATTSNTNIKTDNTPKEATSTIASQDVGLLFVREYYTFLNKKPHRLHAFYNKDSYFIRGDEGENVPTFQGQEEIRKKIEELNFEDCKVLVTQVDSQVSANDGILIQVLGEMCVMDGPSQKFSQTFFLAPQPNGYYVLNDIFRFLKDEVDIDYYTCEDDQQPQSQNKKEEAVPEQPQEQEPEQQQPVNEPITKQPEQELVKEEQQQQKVEEHKEKEIIEESKSKSSDEKKKKQNQNKDEVKVNGTVDHSSSSSNEKASTETSSPATTATTPSTAAATAPAAPTKPAAPKTWANVTANDSTRWGPQASEAKGSVSPVTTTANAVTPKESTPQQSQQQPSAQPQQPQPQQPQQQQQQQPQQQPQQQQPQQQSQQQSNQPNKDQRKDEVTNIFVKNVYSNVNQDQLHEAFSKFGPIKTLNIVQSRNCAFVDFTTPEACQKALAQHKVTVGSHTVLAEERRQHGGRYGGNRQQQNGSGGNYRHQQGNYRRNTGSGSGGGNNSGRAGGNSGNKSRSGSGNQK